MLSGHAQAPAGLKRPVGQGVGLEGECYLTSEYLQGVGNRPDGFEGKPTGSTTRGRYMR